MLLLPYIPIKTLTVNRGSRADVETNEIVEIGQGHAERIKLIRDPKVCESDVEKRSANDSKENFDEPKPSLVTKRASRIQHENGHHANLKHD